MMSAFRVKSFLLAILASLLLTTISFFVLNSFSSTQIIPCTDGWTQNLIFALGFALVLQIFLAPQILPGHYRIFLAAHAVLILFTLWLGLYPVSPLGYSSGRIPVLRGFSVTILGRNRFVKTGEIVSLQQGAAAGIAPQTLSADFRCSWLSLKGGALDDPNGCETVYVPPNTEYDILRIRIWSSCGLPDSGGQIKISILP